MAFGFLGATERDFRVADLGVHPGEIRIQRQSPLVFGDTLRGAVAKDQDEGQR